MELKGKNVGFAITGSFCTIPQVLIELRNIVNEGANVIPILSYSVDAFDTRFGTAAELKEMICAITGNEIFTKITDSEPIGPKCILDILLISPCTGNTTAKIANAITDTPVTMAVKSHLRNERPVVLSISTNDGLGANAKNIGLLLNTKNIFFVPFYQDDPMNKSNSIQAKSELTIKTLETALDGKQIQPVLCS